jgi:hypothetical protein
LRCLKIVLGDASGSNPHRHKRASERSSISRYPSTRNLLISC